MKRSWLACSASFAVLASSLPAWADDLTLAAQSGTTVSTATASNGTPGNITVQFGGLLVVNVSGAAVTLNSNNSVNIQGGVFNGQASGAIGVHILGGNTGDLTLSNPGGEADLVAAGVTGPNYAILVDGSGTYNGNITSTTGTTTYAAGKDSVAVAIDIPMVGNVSIGSAVTAQGINAEGVRLKGQLTGLLSLSGTIAANGNVSFSEFDDLSGSAIAIGANVTNGVIVTGQVDSSDTTTSSGSISSASNAPTILISPTVKGPGAPTVNIGILASDAKFPTYSFINRGFIKGQTTDPGVSPTAIRIENANLPGGIYNGGTIVASGESDNLYAFNHPSAPTNAIGVDLGPGASICAAPCGSAAAFFNDGFIAAQVQGTNTGNATAIVVRAGATLTSLINDGDISGTVTSSDATVSNLVGMGILDLSGNLTTIVNTVSVDLSGNNRVATITGATSLLDDNSQKGVAVDISHTSLAETIKNNGTITGDVLFGSGANTLTIFGTTQTGNGTFVAINNGGISAAGAGTLTINVSMDGSRSGGTLQTASTKATTINIGQNGTASFTPSKNSGATPFIVTTGNFSMEAGSHVTVTPATFLPKNSNFTLIHANGSLSIADIGNTTQNSFPIFYTGSIQQTGNDLTLSLVRKSATDIGLTGNAAAIYEPLADAAVNDDAFGSALLSLGSVNAVQTAINSTVPDIAGGVRALTIALTDQASGVIGARRRALVTSDDHANDFRFWGQEFYNVVGSGSSANSSGFGGSGQGAALGVEWGSLATGRYGLGYTFFSSQETESHPRDTKTNGDWHLLTAYAGWRADDVFFSPQVSVGEGDFLSRRTVQAGTFQAAPTAQWASYIASGGVSTGYILDLGDFQIIPEISVDGMLLRETAYDETGAGGVDLHLSGQTQKSLRGFAGVVAQGSYAWDDANFKPQFIAGWSHDFMNDPATIDGTFESAPGSPFHLVGPTLDQDRVIGGASFAYVLRNWSAGVNYDATAGSNSVGQSATVSLSSRF